MHLNDLNPLSQVSAVVLPSTGTASDVNNYVPFGIYSDSTSEFYSIEFLSGAAEQVNYTYKKLGGDVLDIELTPGNVYANYEESVLEYSYIVNLHQAKNTLSRVMGSTTGTFDHDGILQTGSFKTSLSGSHASLKYPKFSFDYANDIMQGVGGQVPIGNAVQEYSASFSTITDVQDYDIQKIVRDKYLSGAFGPYFNLHNKKVKITKVYYTTAQASWRFFGQYGQGGISVLGNLANYSGYGMYADDSTFEVVPVWQNLAQGTAYKGAIEVRCSNFSYELVGSYLRLFPIPQLYTPTQFWFKFTLENNDVWNEEFERDGTKLDSGRDGVNGMNTIPFEILPYVNINSIGKHWIRDYCYQLSLETLGRIRSKFDPIPIPGNNNISLDGKELISQSQQKQQALREELFKILEETSYVNLSKQDAELLDNNASIGKHIPLKIFIG